jgi:hypothetical protein
MSCVTLVQVVGALDGCPVGLDDSRVHHVECAQMLQGVSPADRVIVPAALRDQGSRRPGGDPPRMAIRSAMSSTMARTASTCGSSMVYTAMKFGPTTFQCTCLRVARGR